MWTCPKCQRKFRNANQQHACKLVQPEDLFEKRPPGLLALYKKIVSQVGKWGESRIEGVAPNVVYFKTKSTFLGVKVMKDHLLIEFFLEQLEDVPPVSKFLQTSKHRWVHYVPVDSEKELNKQLLSWMKRSYDLVTQA